MFFVWWCEELSLAKLRCSFLLSLCVNLFEFKILDYTISTLLNLCLTNVTISGAFSGSFDTFLFVVIFIKIKSNQIRAAFKADKAT